MPNQYAAAFNSHLSALEQGHDIVFLHNVQNGAAEKSYGIAVAKLAGLPARALKAAQRQLKQLEQQTADRQLDLFAAPPEEADAPAAENPVLQQLVAVNPDELTPRQALDVLYRLKAAAEG